MKRFLIYVSYFGTRYRGFQKQNFDGKRICEDPHTVCGLLEIALKACQTSSPPVVYPSSRTDKGVHAISNTVHVDLEQDEAKPLSPRGITIHLNRFFVYNDHDIRVLKVQQVSDTFHCRFNAIERQYMYRFAVPRTDVSWQERLLITYPIMERNKCLFLQNPSFDEEAVKAACNIFIGTHDFAALCSKVKNKYQYKEVTTQRSINTLQLERGRPLLAVPQLLEEYDFWQITCSAKSFLYHQVRRMVSALIKYGQGRVTLEDLQRLLSEPRDSSWQRIGEMVPPEGLYLLQVSYSPQDLELPEHLKEEVLMLARLEEEAQQIYKDLQDSNRTVLEKIDLRKRLLDIRKKSGA